MRTAAAVRPSREPTPTLGSENPGTLHAFPRSAAHGLAGDVVQIAPERQTQKLATEPSSAPASRWTACYRNALARARAGE